MPSSGCATRGGYWSALNAGYPFEAIRAVLDELAAGRPSTAIERRRHELTRASERCARATAALWSYAVEAFDKPPALSGSLKRDPR